MTTYQAPKGVRESAQRALDWLKEGLAGSGFTDVGRRRASQLANGSPVSEETIARMRSYFARHEVDRKAEGFNSGEKGYPSAGRVAWEAWGGDAGRSWANSFADSNSDKTATLQIETQLINSRTNMTDRTAHAYAEITKADRNADGTLTVYGKATDDSIDIDQQICDDTWLKRAMPDWMLSGGNVREQHSNIAAGVATDYELKDDGHYITALVVDPVSVKKVETGVLKGFSIGIRSPRVIRDDKAAGGRIIDGQIVEVSLVDRPANPNAKLMLAKAIESGELMAVEQINIPLPNEVFKNADPVEPVTEVVEEVVADSPEAVDPVSETEVSSETPEVVEGDEVIADQESLKAADLLNTAKTLLKFDQATFDRARQELANLIIVEAKEMADEGHNEKDSIEHLLDSVKHLFRWYEGEVEAGEVENPIQARETEVSEIADEILLSVEADEKCDKCDSLMKECKCADKSATIDFDDAQIESIVEKAVSQAKESVTEEISRLKSALEAERIEKAQIAEELATANKAVAGGGPKRSVTGQAESVTNDLLAKATELRFKASQTQDRVLSKGYLAWAEDLEAQSKKVV